MADTTAPTVVFVHGGQHTGACWRPTVDAIGRADPSVRALAVDLPGHGAEPGDLVTLTIDHCVRSVVRQIDAVGASRVVLVGHSMAGITLPGVATQLGAERVSRMVYVACCVPAQGKTVVAGLVPESAAVTKEAVDRSRMPDLPTTWIITLRDRSLRPGRQRAFIANLGNVDEVLEIDTCHDAMISEPEQLAQMLLARL